MRPVLLALFVLFLAALPARALEEGGRAVAVQVVDGDTLVLDSGEKVRLVGIQAPKLPLGRPDFEPWPLGEEAKEALERLALGKPLRLVYGGRKVDRHGRLLAQLYTEDGVWVQGALLEAGMARVYTFADNRALAAEMLERERRARAAGLGLWADPFYRILSPAEAGAHVGRFELVEGTVVSASVVKGRGYLNFGADWRTDFTVAIPKADLERFDEAGIEIAAYAGHTVRVRGWIKSFNGPMIEATHPEQIELVP